MQALALCLIAIPLVAYLGYPVIIVVASRFAPRRADVGACAMPAISILICAHNEAASVAAKLDSVLDAVAAYPGAAEIIVGDDGSGDATAAIVETYLPRGIRLIRAQRGGKAATLAKIVAIATGEVLVMTDADPLFDAGTLPALLAPFADPQVGAVAGSVETIRGGRLAAADTVFRRYESALRAAEDRLFGCIAADGGLYAIRAALMPGIPPDVTDDFYISTAAVAAGRRIAFAPQAKVYEHSIPGDRQNFRRRVRITVRGLTGLWRRRGLMNPARTGWYAVALVLHKVARRLAPLALPPLWIVAGVLAAGGSMVWGLVFAGLSGAVLLGLVGYCLPVRLPRPLAVAYGAVLHLAGLGAGFALFVGGRRYSQWAQRKVGA